MRILKAFVSGLIGALTLTLVHRGAREVIDEAPRADLIGMRFISRKMRQMNIKPKSQKGLYWMTVLDNVLTNTLYFSLVGAGSPRGAWARGAALGTLGGVGAVYLPPQLGLGKAEVQRTTQTQAMMVGWYLLGGLAAAGAYNLLDRYIRDY